MSPVAAWILTYALVAAGFFALIHHFDHTHVTSNYSVVECNRF